MYDDPYDSKVDFLHSRLTKFGFYPLLDKIIWYQEQVW